MRSKTAPDVRCPHWLDGLWRSRGFGSDRGGRHNPLRRLSSRPHGSGPPDRIGRLGRRASEAARCTIANLLRGRLALEREQPLLDGRCRIGGSDGRDLFRLPFRSIRCRLGSRLHPALFQNAFGRAREADLRRHGERLLPNLSAGSAVRPPVPQSRIRSDVPVPGDGWNRPGFRRRRLRRPGSGSTLSMTVEFWMFVIVPRERAITMGGGRWRPSFEMHCLLWCWG